METLAEYLGVVDEVMNDLADDLADIRELRLPGTCEWILEKEYYLNWKDSEPSDFPPVLWIAGKPATGKSVLSGFIVDDLEVSDAAYSYYFFKHGDRSKSALSTCLRSLAFQMASLDPGIRDLFLKLHSSRVKVDYGNERSLWRTFFAPKVFKEATVQHFWVIDALDECSNFAPLLESMLSKMENDGRLRILITSRETPELCRLFSTLGPGKHFTAHISPEETLSDIKRLVEHKRSALCTLDEETCQILEKRIIEKSKGSFLWTVLVLEELSKSYIRRDVETVLEEVPRGMGQLYYRALEAMAVATRGKELAKALLTWTACVIRPLTLAELQAALEIDLRDKIANMKETIRTLCGQLLVIDKQERVQMVHETAREFLLDTQLVSEFAVDETQAHTRIARVCLEYLVGDEMKPPRIVARGSASSRAAKKSDFFLYASTMFSTHLAKANPTSDEIVTLVEKFLELNILTWIEKIAERRELGLMINVAKDLRTYADCYMAARSPSRRDLQALKSWSQDLQRITAKFADILISCPSTIYNRIQAFCPQDSAIHSLSPPGKKLSVLGLPVLPWDDRLSCLGFEKETTALRYGEEFLVVGMREGRIAVYHADCYHEYRNLNHGETVRHLDLQEKYGFLASAGGKTIQIWNIRTGQVLHRLRAPRQCIGLFFVDNILTAVSNQNELVSWNVRNEEVLEYTRDPWLKWANDEFLSLHRPPSAVSVAVAQKMMAVAYASHPVTIWDLEGNTYVGECGKKLVTGETSTHPVVALLFNPNPDIGLLAISYLDGDLAIVDPFADIELERQRPSCHTLAASPDGHLLAGGGGGGIIQIWKFDTLTLLYKVKSSDIFIKVLAFSHDGSTLADLRGSQCNIWTPPILLSSSYLKDDLSVDTVDTEEIAKELTDLTPKPKITSLVIIPNKKGIICGLEDGSVRLYENNTGNLVAKLYSHVSAAVNTLSWLPRSQRVISTCVANRIMAQAVEMQVYPSCGIRSVTTSPIVNIRLNIGSTIIHLLPDPTENLFLLSSHRSDHLWNLSSREEEQSINHGSYTTRRWLQHPRSESHLICVEPEFVHLHRWEDLSRVSSVSLANNSLLGLSIKGVFPYPRRDIVLLDLTDANGSSGTRDMSVLHCNDIPQVLDDEEAGCERNPLSNKPQTNVPSAHQDLSRKALGKQPEQSLGQLLSISRLGSLRIRVAHVVGILASPRGSRMVFLNARSWVCSVLIDTIIQPNANVTSYTQHFFVPHDWLAGTRKPIGGIMENGDLVFTKAGDVAIIKGWLDFGEVVELESAQKGNGQEAREKGRPALRREGSSKLGAPSRERSSLR
jgi:FOG: WD40 repeat